MSDFKTVEGTSAYDAIRSVQREDVARMRTSLLSCSIENPISTKIALQQITILRIHHQISRIIRYLDLMDKLEEKLYDSIENTIDRASTEDPGTWMMLMRTQERLQASMIESHKLLQPYLDISDFSITELLPESSESADATTLLIPSESRETIRNKAQAVLLALNAG